MPRTLEDAHDWLLMVLQRTVQMVRGLQKQEEKHPGKYTERLKRMTEIIEEYYPLFLSIEEDLKKQETAKE
jgi:hypothetical protein